MMSNIFVLVLSVAVMTYDVLTKLIYIVMSMFIIIVSCVYFVLKTVRCMMMPAPRRADNDAGQWPGTQQGINDHLNRFEARLS